MQRWGKADDYVTSAGRYFCPKPGCVKTFDSRRGWNNHVYVASCQALTSGKRRKTAEASAGAYGGRGLTEQEVADAVAREVEAVIGGAGGSSNGGRQLTAEDAAAEEVEAAIRRAAEELAAELTAGDGYAGVPESDSPFFAGGPPGPQHEDGGGAPDAAVLVSPSRIMCGQDIPDVPDLETVPAECWRPERSKPCGPPVPGNLTTQAIVADCASIASHLTHLHGYMWHMVFLSVSTLPQCLSPPSDTEYRVSLLYECEYVASVSESTLRHRLSV